MIKITTLRHDDVDISLIKQFTQDNWGVFYDSPEEIKLNFFRQEDYYVLAYAGSKLVGSIGLQIRLDILIDDRHASCGMIGGVVVHKDHRMQGIAAMMLKEAMGKFAKEKVDIAMLGTDIEKLARLYAKVGFVVLGKKYYFYNLNNELSSSDDGMIAAVSDKKIFDLAIQANSKINIGPSNA